LRAAICAAALGLASAAGAQGRISGTVYDSLRTHAPLANATVVLVERDKYTTTDAQGRFLFDSMPDGHYTIGFMHPVLDSLEMEGPMVAVDLAAGQKNRTDIALATPSAATIYTRLCRGVLDTGVAVLIGRVRDVDTSAPLANAAIGTGWTEYTITAGRPVGHRMGLISRTNAGGLYVLCGVPTNVPLEILSARDGFVAGPVPLQIADRLISRVDFAISRRDSAARGPQLSDSQPAAVASGVGTAILRGTLRDAAGRPVRDAMIGVSGSTARVRTDSAGAFRLDQIPAGTRTIDVRSIGSAPATVSLDFATNATRDTTLTLGRMAQELKTIAVEGQTMSVMDGDGFETRRQHALGTYVIQADIAKHSYPDLAAVLRDTKGITIECNATKRLQGVPCMPIAYMIGISNYSQVRCMPNYFLDGAPYRVAGPTGFSDFSFTLPVATIRGIEVYTTPGSIPAQYDLTSSTGCGSIVIWTH
jgi:hypothetical protein